MCVHVGVCMCVHVCVHMCVCMCVCACVCACVHVCMWVCMCVHEHVGVHKERGRGNSPSPLMSKIR